MSSEATEARPETAVRPGPAGPSGEPAPDRADFVRLTDPFRKELLAHCYRMVGSVHDAEDLVQETYLRAWRSFDGFEGRSSLRFWLYRVATNACLASLEHRSRRLLPSGLGAPSEDPEQRLVVAGRDVSWVQPLPDTVLSTMAADPAAVVASRGSFRLALIAALQYLPARQRVVLLMREVLGWPAAEVAELLGTSTAAVNSALQRARAQLERVGPIEDEVEEPDEPRRRALLEQYVAAFERADIPALLRLLRADVTLEMPPNVTWFAGRDAVLRFMSTRILTAPGAHRLLGTTANGQPALAAYRRGPDGWHHAHALQLLTFSGDRIGGILAFLDGELFDTFGLPPRLAPARTRALR
ncbi:sigma-70 family RNA polymerase sigma factor [Streptomyces sedi]|uniref:Sigma-70 family RNA polymerase sigma factor n=1 Tax=Streptomyces sedi TaxID=555059 RepID=A0A5C4VEK6_9ACTN|nr:sigma-70 family RNA polymerase sigma factor [Streptomyces sedi]TNM34334.1 sigma-70 family RNA polymerase sigma factor [Streptomyces sedi]